LHLNVVNIRRLFSFTGQTARDRGYFVPLCVCAVVCTFGYHGPNCNDRCSHCSDEKCFRNGTCIAGCQTGWTGRDCETEESSRGIRLVTLDVGLDHRKKDIQMINHC